MTRSKRGGNGPARAKVLPGAAPLAHGHTSIAFRLPLAGRGIPFSACRQIPMGQSNPPADLVYMMRSPAQAAILLT